MVDWSVIMFWSEWDSDLRSSTPQSRTLTNRQRRFLYLVVFYVSSLWYRGGLVCEMFWSEWVSDLRSSTMCSGCRVANSVLCLFLMVPWWIGQWLRYFLVIPTCCFGPSGNQTCDLPHLSQGLYPLDNGASYISQNFKVFCFIEVKC